VVVAKAVEVEVEVVVVVEQDLHLRPLLA